MNNSFHNTGTEARICAVENKKMFSHALAVKYALQMRRTKNTNHAPYYCRACAHFHIGSSESRRQRRRRRYRRTQHLDVKMSRGAR
jgi:hypothetical protein